jgi:hypothetical protein
MQIALLLIFPIPRLLEQCRSTITTFDARKTSLNVARRSILQSRMSCERRWISAADSLDVSRNCSAAQQPHLRTTASMRRVSSRLGQHITLLALMGQRKPPQRDFLSRNVE